MSCHGSCQDSEVEVACNSCEPLGCFGITMCYIPMAFDQANSEVLQSPFTSIRSRHYHHSLIAELLYRSIRCTYVLIGISSHWFQLAIATLSWANGFQL